MKVEVFSNLQQAFNKTLLVHFFTSTGMSQVTARINSEYADASGNDPDLQLFFSGFLAKCAYSGEIKAAADPENPKSPKVLLVSPVALHPKSHGYIGLKSSDPLESPKMVANYLTDEEDLKILISGIRIIEKLTNATILKKYGISLAKKEYGTCALKYE